MALPLEGLVVALAEGRQLEELAQLLEREGATALRCPLINIIDAPDERPVLAWLADLIANRFDYVVFFTGEGVNRLLGFADRAGWRADYIAALGRTRLITRGPKPVRALRELGVVPHKVAEAPTTDGVIATLRGEELQGKTVGIQLFGSPNPPLEEFLKSAGATAAVVLPYFYAPAVDSQRVADLIHRLAQGEVAALVFTSASQVDRLYEVATERKLESELATGLMRTKVAAVGPIVADNLRHHGAPVDICPEQGFVMKNLVKHIKTALTSS
ncbi:MAG: uroporphyrinogen-III synthase [Gemmataceae bacterium]